MSDVTILFESVEAATKAFRTLKPMVEVSLDCNALAFNEIDEELVKWLIRDWLRHCPSGNRYCPIEARERVYIPLSY